MTNFAPVDQERMDICQQYGSQYALALYKGHFHRTPSITSLAEEALAEDRVVLEESSFEELAIADLEGLSPRLASMLDNIGVTWVKDLFRYNIATILNSPGIGVVAVGELFLSIIKESMKRDKAWTAHLSRLQYERSEEIEEEVQA